METSKLIIDRAEQGTKEWHTARAGVPTASQFNKIITTKGAPSDQRRKYLLQLAGQRITGMAEESYKNFAMQRGTELEPEARASYEMETGETVETVGFIYKCDKMDRGCSPDGLIGDEGGLEIKCPTIAEHCEYVLARKLPTKYFQQVQGSMYITGRRWWDFYSYYPGMPSLLIRVERDINFCAALARELDKFVVELHETVNLLLSR